VVTLTFRNIDATPADPVSTWGVEGLATALDRGEVEHWAAILRALERDTTGRLQAQVRQAIDVTQSPGVRALMTRALARLDDPEGWDVTRDVRRAVRRSGLSQGEFAERVGTSRTRLNSYVTGAQLPSARVAARIHRVGAQVARGTSDVEPRPQPNNNGDAHL